jgi:hypothetical protein
MAKGAPLRNQFWKLRAVNAGPAKLFATPEILWEAACEYFQYCIENPLQSVEYVGKGRRVTVPKMRAFTWSGLELYLDIYSFRYYKTDKKYKKFAHVIDKIEKVMYTQKFEGAAAGFLNPAIIARDLGLSDKHEHTGKDGQPLPETKQVIIINGKEIEF